MKPRLPYEIEQIIPSDVLHIIYGFVPHLPKKPLPSPSLQRELEKLQNSKHPPMYMRNLEDFVLDRR